MNITKRQLRRLIKEEYDAYSNSIENIRESNSIERIREEGDPVDMKYEVSDIMNSMGPGALSGKEAYDMIVDAINTEPADVGRFWHDMLSPGGPIGEAIKGLMNTADEDYDPDRPGLQGSASASSPAAGGGTSFSESRSSEGTSIDEMPAAWQQILRNVVLS